MERGSSPAAMKHDRHYHLIQGAIFNRLTPTLLGCNNNLKSVPRAPPKLQTEPATLETVCARAFSSLSIAGVSGFCQAIYVDNTGAILKTIALTYVHLQGPGPAIGGPGFGPQFSSPRGQANIDCVSHIMKSVTMDSFGDGCLGLSLEASVTKGKFIEDGNHLYRFLDDDPIVSQCHNIPKEDGKHIDYRSIHGSEDFARFYLRTIEELHRVELQDMRREERDLLSYKSLQYDGI
ncbi:hypothetical protein M0R45_036331 [Rubus argutus]|uniref:Uncharacterized protein n=1 Tax=Rubus argutus TaxID=59490 RepID=A0AAW1VZX5_RUBAR